MSEDKSENHVNGNGIVEEFSPQLNEAIRKIIEDEGFLTYEIKKGIMTTAGGGYLGDLFEVDVKGKTLHGNKELNIFVKRIIYEAIENMKKQMPLLVLYEREAFTYTGIAKIFKELEDEAKIPEHDRPKMVKGYDGSSTEAIILENVAKQGYKTGSRLDLVSYKFARMSIEHLAKFHALGFAMEKLRPKFFGKNIKTMQFPVNWFRSEKNITYCTVSNIKDETIRKKVEKFSPNIAKKFHDYLSSNRNTVRTLCHGDFRANNILMKETNGELTDIIPVDYQLIYYGCPINDFLYFMYLGTDGEFRKKHFAELKEIYYNTMKRYLKYFYIDINDILPRKEFEKIFEESKDFGLVFALIYFVFLYVRDDEILDLANQSVDDAAPGYDDRFHPIFTEIFEECYVE